jgi:hypothetical protein
MPEPRRVFRDCGEQELNSVQMSEEVVAKKLSALKINKSPGIDGIAPRILKELAEELALPLCLIFTNSLITSVVPGDWKLANVTRIYKKGPRNQPGNYRPVSLTCIIGKVFESIIRDMCSGTSKEFQLDWYKSTWLHEKSIVFNKPSAFSRDCIRLCRSRTSSGCYLLGLPKGF